MRALKPAQPIEPTETTDMPDQSDQVPSMEAPSIPPAEEDIPVSPVAPEIGQSPDQDMTPNLDPPPGNWTVSHDDLYSQRQQVQSPSLNEPELSTPGTAPKARGPPLPATEARQSGVTIMVPLPLRQRMNPHMPPPRINVPIPKMPYAFHPRNAGVPFPTMQMARIPQGSEVTQVPQPPRALPLRRQVRTIRVPLRGPPPTPPMPQRQRVEDDAFLARMERPPFNVFTPVPGIARSPSVVGVPYSGATPSFTTPRNPAPMTRSPGPSELILRPRRLDFEERPDPRIRVTGTEPPRVWQPKFEMNPTEFMMENTMTMHPNETSISPTSPGDQIPDPHLSIDEILAGITESPYPLQMLIGTPIPPASPDKLSTDDEYQAPSHPGMTTLYAPAEGVTTSSLDPRQANQVGRDHDTLDNMTPNVHEEDIPISSMDPIMPESTLSPVPPIETMVIGIGDRNVEISFDKSTHDPQATGVGTSEPAAVDHQATGIGSTEPTAVDPQASGIGSTTEAHLVQSVSKSVKRSYPPSPPQEATGVGSPSVIPTHLMSDVSGVGPIHDTRVDPVVGSAASSSSQPIGVQPSGPLEPQASGPDPNEIAQTNLRSIMADFTSVPLEGQPPPEPASTTVEPDAEPANLKYNEAWKNFEGKLIIISGHPNSGKSTVTAELIQLFQLYKTKTSSRYVWLFTDTGNAKTATRTLLHFTNDTFWKQNQIDFPRLIQSYEDIKLNHSPKAITVIEGHRMFLCTDLIPKCYLCVWIHTPHKTRRLRGNRISDQEWNKKLVNEVQYYQKVLKLLKSEYVQILCGLDSARKNAMLLLAMMVLNRKGPLNKGPTHQYIAPNIDVSRMKDLDYDDWLLDRHEPINVQHAIRDHLLDTPWEPPTSASAPS